MIRRVRRLLSLLFIPAYLQIVVCLVYWFLIGAKVIMPQGMAVNVIMGLLFALGILEVFTGFVLRTLYIDGLEKSIQDLEELNTHLRRQRHDYMNEMQIVYGLLELGEHEEALKFLKPIYADAARTGRALKTALPAVNALIMNKLKRAEELKIDFYMEISTNLKLVPVDEWSLCKVLGNLIDNAMTAASAAQQNGETPEVHLSLQEYAEYFEMSIYNNGPLIPENQRELIFRNGFTSKKGEGHGYGLGIVKDIVRSCGGEILVDSREGKTMFTVSLPKKHRMQE